MDQVLQEFINTKGGVNLASKFTQVPLTPEQNKKWGDTQAMLMWTCPAFTHILYNMMDNGLSPNLAVFTNDKTIPTAATDGVNIIINIEFFFALPAAQRVFVVAHEILHAVLNHVALDHKLKLAGKVWTSTTTSLPYNGDAMNIAEDLIINDMLISGGIGEYNSNWWHNKKLGNENDDRISVYEKLFKKPPPAGQMSFDKILDPGAASGQDPNKVERSDVEWANALAAGLALGKMTGRMPLNIEKLFTALLEPKVDWTEKIEAFFARKVGSGSYNWRKPDRRLIVRDIYSPGRSGFGAGTVVVGFDTSGSIYSDPTLINRFLAEVGGILSDIRPKRLCVVWCDAVVHRVDEPEDLQDLETYKALGGGGTSFVPVFDWIEENVDECDALIYLTDGQGSFPDKAPKYPVLWGDIAGTEYPFGEVVKVPTK